MTPNRTANRLQRSITRALRTPRGTRPKRPYSRTVPTPGRRPGGSAQRRGTPVDSFLGSLRRGATRAMRSRRRRRPGPGPRAF